MKKPVVDIFIPCFIDQMYPETGINMVRVLEKLGCQVRYNANQTCCGQVAFNAGYKEECGRVAHKFLQDFSNEESDFIVSPSASCVGMVRNAYADIFKTSSEFINYRTMEKKVYEFSEFLVDVLQVTKVPGSRLQATVTYHDSCSALRECGIKAGPRLLLANVAGLSLVEMAETETCCGFGGTFAVKFPGISVAMAEQKVENALATGVEYIVSTDTSCLMHLDAYMKKNNKSLKVMHLADVLAQGI
jgi:L-lactate dehydrogenase complex protein LldE